MKVKIVDTYEDDTREVSMTKEELDILLWARKIGILRNDISIEYSEEVDSNTSDSIYDTLRECTDRIVAALLAIDGNTRTLCYSNVEEYSDKLRKVRNG